jgi:two-component system invasion response regulator UvrY
MTKNRPQDSVQTRSGPGLRVLIIDDHALLRDGLKRLIAQHFRSVRIGEAGDGATGISMAEKEEWDVVILDISLPGQSGVEVLKQIKTLRPAAKILILTMHPESQYAVRVLKAGASGYLTKETAGQEMVGAINKVLAGGKYVSSTLAERLASSLGVPDKAPHELLSDREYQVMRMLAMGKTVKEISYELKLSVKTISTYRTRIMEKFNFKTTADVVRYALEEKLI